MASSRARDHDIRGANGVPRREPVHQELELTDAYQGGQRHHDHDEHELDERLAGAGCVVSGHASRYAHSVAKPTSRYRTMAHSVPRWLGGRGLRMLMTGARGFAAGRPAAFAA